MSSLEKLLEKYEGYWNKMLETEPQNIPKIPIAIVINDLTYLYKELEQPKKIERLENESGIYGNKMNEIIDFINKNYND